MQFLVSLENVQAEDKAKLLAGMATILCGVKKDEDENEKLVVPKVRQPLQQINRNVPMSSLSSVVSTDNNAQATSYSNRVSLSSVGSVSSNSSSELSSYLGNQLPDSLDMIDSAFTETSGLETSLARAVSASINIAVTDLHSDNEDLEEMAGSLPPMHSFLGL